MKLVPSGFITLQIRRATFPRCGRHGKIVKLSRSGYRHWSDSSMRTKPSMEDPSSMISLLTAFSICEAVIATFLSVPKTSVNCIRMNCTSSSRTMRIISSFV